MTVSGFLRNVQGISNSTQGAVDTLGRLTGRSYWAQLRPASYRGVPFGVFDGTGKFGRRNAVHEYPFRDLPWVEDLGRAARRITMSGFLVGDDVIAQRDRLIQACESPGSPEGDELIHPTLGLRKVALLDFSTSERWDQGRVFEVQFSFIEQGRRLYPTASTSAASAAAGAETAAGKGDAAALRAFAARAVSALRQGAAVANAAAREASAYAAVALQASTDSTSLFKLAVGLPGEFGRMLGQLNGITLGQLLPVSVGTTMQTLSGQAAASRVKVSAAASTLAAAGAALGPTTTAALITGAQGLTEAVRAGAPTPGDAVRALLALVNYTPAQDGTGAALVAQQAAGDAFRRAAVMSLARAGAQYRPVSADDALTVRAAVLGAMDSEITVAGDQGEDEVYRALQDARTVTVQALNAAGAGLPTLATVRSATPAPSLVLAQRLYRDVDRADELVARANPIHPAFMPVTFQALNQ